MSKVCNVRGCKKKVPQFIQNNPQGEPLCAVCHGFQVRLNEDRIKCTIVGCSNMAYSSGLCKNHTHTPHEVRMDLRREHSERRKEKLQEILGPALNLATSSKTQLDTLEMSNFNCLYCGEPAHTSLGPSPPHCCPVCWAKIQKC